MKATRYLENIIEENCKRVFLDGDKIDYITLSPTSFDLLMNCDRFKIVDDVIMFCGAMIEEGDLNNPVVMVHVIEKRELETFDDYEKPFVNEGYEKEVEGLKEEMEKEIKED